MTVQRAINGLYCLYHDALVNLYEMASTSQNQWERYSIHEHMSWKYW